MHRRLSAVVVWCAVAGTWWVAIDVDAATAPAVKCLAAKRALIGKEFVALTKCESKAVSHGEFVFDVACIDPAGVKFVEAWNKVEQKGGCNQTGLGSTLSDVMRTDAFVFAGELVNTTSVTSKCTAAKLKAVGKKALCRAKCARAAAIAGVVSSDPTVTSCMATCATKFTAAFAKAEGVTNGNCVTMNDATTMETNVDVPVSDVLNDCTHVLQATPCGSLAGCTCQTECVDPFTTFFVCANTSSLGSACVGDGDCPAGQICIAEGSAPDFTICSANAVSVCVVPCP